ncbi:hypothetical protein NXW31_21320 [Bacteroides fragilis]|nr:hypothetical protein [Bacteroides fragilis]
MKLLDYIRGARKGKEAHRLEKEAMRDPFLADALEGYSRVGNGADEQIEELRRRIRARAVRKRNHAVVWSIAASLLIGVCIGSYFLFQEKPLSDEARMAMEQAVHPKPLSVYEEEKKDELAEAVIKDSAGPSKKLISENKKKKCLRLHLKFLK